MGLNCGCPEAAALPSLVITDCSENLGQIQKVIFQRVFSASGVKNKIATPAVKASWTALFSSLVGTKTVITPYVSAPVSEPGAARVFGGGNATVSGIEILIGRNPSKFTAMIYGAIQATIIAVLKAFECENVGVYLVDENGNIGCLKVGVDYFPIPIKKLFVGDKKFGGFEEPDSNTIEWSFLPNWSDNFTIVEPTDFNPLTDLVNG